MALKFQKLTRTNIRKVQPGDKLQAHTSGISPDGMYFYSTASHDGVFFRIDLDTWEISKTYIGGNLLMGSFVWNGEGVNM